MARSKEKKKHLRATIEKIDKHLYKNVSIFLYFDWCNLRIILLQNLKEDDKK